MLLDTCIQLECMSFQNGGSIPSQLCPQRGINTLCGKNIEKSQPKLTLAGGDIHQGNQADLISTPFETIPAGTSDVDIAAQLKYDSIGMKLNSLRERKNPLRRGGNNGQHSACWRHGPILPDGNPTEMSLGTRSCLPMRSYQCVTFENYDFSGITIIADHLSFQRWTLSFATSKMLSSLLLEELLSRVAL